MGAELKPESAFARQVGAQAARKLRAQREGKQGAWFGLGVSGLIGWSVAVPTLIAFSVLPYGRNLVPIDIDAGILFFFASAYPYREIFFRACGALRSG